MEYLSRKNLLNCLKDFAAQSVNKVVSYFFSKKIFFQNIYKWRGGGRGGTHPALRRRGDVAAMSLCTSQWRRRYVSNETPKDVSMERREDVSTVRLHDVLLESHYDVSKWRNNDVPLLRLHDVSNKS